MTGKELKRFKNNPDNNIYIRVASLRLIPKKSKYRISFLLHNNKKASEIRQELFSNNITLYYELCNSHSCNSFDKKYEKELGYLIDNIFGNYHKIDKQVKCGNYKIDFVIDDCIAIECDENGHASYDQHLELAREKFILSKKYKILRYDTRNNNMLDFIGKISNELAFLHVDGKH